MSPAPDPSRTTSFSEVTTSKPPPSVARATTRWIELVPISIAAWTSLTCRDTTRCGVVQQGTHGAGAPTNHVGLRSSIVAWIVRIETSAANVEAISAVLWDLRVQPAIAETAGDRATGPRLGRRGRSRRHAARRASTASRRLPPLVRRSFAGRFRSRSEPVDEPSVGRRAASRRVLDLPTGPIELAVGPAFGSGEHPTTQARSRTAPPAGRCRHQRARLRDRHGDPGRGGGRARRLPDRCRRQRPGGPRHRRVEPRRVLDRHPDQRGGS